MDPHEQARQKIAGPAVALLIASGIAFAWYAFCVLAMLVVGSISFIDPTFGRDSILGGMVGAAVYGIFALASVFLFVGAFRMKDLKSYELSVTTAIIAILPCSSYVCCVLIVPFGVWALLVLLKPDVRAAFE